MIYSFSMGTASACESFSMGTASACEFEQSISKVVQKCNLQNISIKYQNININIHFSWQNNIVLCHVKITTDNYFVLLQV